MAAISSLKEIRDITRDRSEEIVPNMHLELKFDLSAANRAVEDLWPTVEWSVDSGLMDEDEAAKILVEEFASRVRAKEI